ncbi:uncharacterized protein LOC135392778 [Ornithodoros turicata]|uniref:uncharacterized protein LOC135392778 n=1 Tax=Ornithodoros turicata TaxID=34597 RepID=UPI00313933AF
MRHCGGRRRRRRRRIPVLVLHFDIRVATVAMLAAFLAFTAAASVLSPAHSASMALTDLLPDLRVRAVHPSNHTGDLSESKNDAPTSTFDFDVRSRHFYAVLLVAEEKDVQWFVVNAHDEKLANHDVVIGYSPLAGRRQYVIVVFDQGRVRFSNHTVAKLSRILQRGNRTWEMVRTGFGTREPLVMRKFSAESNAAVQEDVEPEKRSADNDDGCGSSCPRAEVQPGGSSGVDNRTIVPGSLVDNLTRAGILPHFLDSPPTGEIDVDYGYGRVIRMGNYFVAQYLWLEPLNVTFDMEDGKLYALVLTDITITYWQYWLVVNIVTKDVYSGDELIMYSGPFPTTGTNHTLVFLAYSQGTTEVDVKKLQKEGEGDLSTKDPRVFARENKMGDPIAMNYFITDAELKEKKAKTIHDSEEERRRERKEAIARRRKTKEFQVEPSSDANAGQEAAKTSGVRKPGIECLVLVTCLVKSVFRQVFSIR